jgi:phosphate/sulfate permease
MEVQMKIIFIYIISGIIIAIISFIIYKLISIFLQKESKIAEELIKMDNGKELIKERIKHNSRRIIIYAICFFLSLALILFIIMVITLLIKKNLSTDFL